MIDFVVQNRLTILGGAGYIASCAVITMPVPSIAWDRQALKTWLYDFAHALVLTKNTRLAQQPLLAAPLSAPAAIAPTSTTLATEPVIVRQ